MTTKLTDEQRQALAAHPGQPVDVRDDRSQTMYVLVERNQFQQLLGAAPQEPPAANGEGGLPAWCNVYEGLSEAEITALEEVVLQRADLSRTSA